jgi:ankyrin repeat protein
LREGIDINIRDNYGRTVLMMSAAGGNLSIVQFLLAAGCNSNAQDSFGMRAIDYSIANNHVEVTEFLARRKR